MRLDLHGLVPDPHEFDPSLAHYATFGNGRYPSKVPLTKEQQRGMKDVILAPYELPSLERLRGDEQILFHLTPQTRLSGMPDLDATDRDYVTRDKLAGFFNFPLSQLLDSALAKKPIKDMPIEDPYLYGSILETARPLNPQTIAEARFGATKGTIKELAVIVHPPEAAAKYAKRLKALVEASEKDPRQPLLYGTKRFEAAHEESVRTIARYYEKAFGGYNAQFPKALDRICSVLHMPFYIANVGDTMPLTFFASRHHPRLQPPQADYVGNTFYDISPETLAFYDRAARSCFASAGLSAEGAKRALIQQWQSKRTDELEPLTPRLLDGTFRALQAFGNNLKYRSDDRTPNREWLIRTGRVLDEASGFKGAARLRTRQLLTDYGKHFNNNSTGGQEGEVTIELANESMDDLSQCGILNANDCEDMTKPPLTVASEVVPLDPKQGLDPRRLEKYPFLWTMSLVLQRYDVLGIGAAAKSPYLDPSQKSADGRPRFKFEYNGHIHAIAHPRILMADFIKRGGGGDLREEAPSYFDRLEIDGKATREIAPFETLLPSVNIEGTSPGATLLQPPEEIGAHWHACVEACRNVYRSILRLGAPEGKSEKYESTLGQLFTPRQLPESKETLKALGESFSSFYHAPIHAVSERLAMHNPRYAHFNYVDIQTRSRGVPMEQVMRARPGDKSSNIALVTPYAEATQPELKLLYEVAAVIKNTQPAPAITRFPTIDRSEQPHSLVPTHDLALRRLGHPLSDASFAALSCFKLPKRPPRSAWNTLTRALDNHSFGQFQRELVKKEAQRFSGNNTKGTLSLPRTTAIESQEAGIEKLAPHLDRLDRTVYSFVAPAWAVANANMERIDSELSELYDKGLILDHAMWRDRFMQHCDDLITLALVVPVNPSS